ncbi:NAD-dependent protein deacylase sirtuin-5B, mitochondrial-like [Lycorma delicatula]|uniref:NAD-dependent protein deacylase sirtuin-5B, mitochondrial-like n=1 Tax=Lycorma delicatula TaxID=130591 RepID=UPI003F5168E7
MKKVGRNLTIITTNIDGLHHLAGSKRVIEMHGSVIRTECIKCGNIRVNRNSPICSALKGRELCVKKYQNYPQIPEHDLPHCEVKGCDGLLRPNIVFYGEHIGKKENEIARKIMADTDFVMVIGTSYSIMPVGLWPYHLALRGIPVAEFNTEFSKFTADFKQICI